jgi:hypothetical protein
MTNIISSVGLWFRSQGPQTNLLVHVCYDEYHFVEPRIAFARCSRSPFHNTHVTLVDPNINQQWVGEAEEKLNVNRLLSLVEGGRQGRHINIDAPSFSIKGP